MIRKFKSVPHNGWYAVKEKDTIIVEGIMYFTDARKISDLLNSLKLPKNRPV